jgi:hypothetical protein
VIEAAVSRGQYALAIIGMLAAAIAAFFYLRAGLLMYAAPAGSPASGPAGSGSVGSGASALVTDVPPDVTDGATLAGLKPVASIDGTAPGAVATLLAPPDTEIEVPLAVAIGLTVCVAFTIVAGVSSPVIDFARHATTLF